MARRLKAKPEALAARGFKTAPANADGTAPWVKPGALCACGQPREAPVHTVTPTSGHEFSLPSSHGTGDVRREDMNRAAKAAAAASLLAHAVKLASDARTALAEIVGSQHHATVYAASTVSEGMKAAQSAEQVLKTLTR